VALGDQPRLLRRLQSLAALARGERHADRNLGAHRQVWSTFRSADLATPSTADTWATIGQIGIDLRRLRNEADYDDRVEQLEAKVAEALGFAERILRLLPELEAA